MNFTILAQKYPFLKIRNKTGFTLTIPYQNGDSVSINPGGAIAKIVSSGLTQIPDPQKVEFVDPSLIAIMQDPEISPRTAGNL